MVSFRWDPVAGCSCVAQGSGRRWPSRPAARRSRHTDHRDRWPTFHYNPCRRNTCSSAYVRKPSFMQQVSLLRGDGGIRRTLDSDVDDRIVLIRVSRRDKPCMSLLGGHAKGVLVFGTALHLGDTAPHVSSACTASPGGTPPEVTTSATNSASGGPFPTVPTPGPPASPASSAAWLDDLSSVEAHLHRPVCGGRPRRPPRSRPWGVFRFSNSSHLRHRRPLFGTAGWARYRRQVAVPSPPRHPR